jgi:hypothetical protein
MVAKKYTSYWLEKKKTQIKSTKIWEESEGFFSSWSGKIFLNFLLKTTQKSNFLLKPLKNSNCNGYSFKSCTEYFHVIITYTELELLIL